MQQHVPLIYHQATFDLIEEKPIVLPEAVEELNHLTQTRGIILPPSVWEWYSLKKTVDILKRYFPSYGYACDAATLGTANRYWFNGKYHEIDLLEKGLLWIGRETQEVCSWAIQLNGSDDPPVVISFKNEETSRPFATYHLYAETFSRFISTCIFDGLTVNPDDQTFGWRQGSLLPTELAFFRERFQEGPLTYLFPGQLNYRFFSGHQRMLIYEDENQTSWYFSAATDAELKQLLETVLQCDTLKGEMRLERNGLTSWEHMFPTENGEQEEE